MAILTAAGLTTIKHKAEDIWRDSQSQLQYKTEAQAIKTIKQNQTAEIKEIKDTGKDYPTVTVTWLDTNALVDEESTDVCTLDEPEINSKSKDMVLNLSREVGFSIDDNDLAASIYDFQMAAARGTLAAKKRLDEYLSRQAVLFLDASAGVNLYPAPWTYNAPEKATYIPDPEYNNTAIPHMIQHSILNQINDPWLLDSGGLFIDYLNAGFNSGNLDGKGDQARYGALDITFDQFSFAAAGFTGKTTFMANRHAVAFASKNYNMQNSPQLFAFQDGSQYRYSVASDNIPGVIYDVYYGLDCEGKRVKHHWKFVITAGFLLNPEADATTRVGGLAVNTTGILKYSNAEPE